MSWHLLSIEEDVKRFKEIIKGKVRDNLRKYLAHPEKIVSPNGKKIVVPFPTIDIPRFKFNDQDMGGVGQGEGPMKPGDEPGEHELEQDFTPEDFIDLVAEELHLPLLNKNATKITSNKKRYNRVQRYGTKIIPKRTLKEAIKRQIGSGTYNYNNPVIVPEKPDFRYQDSSTITKEETQAVIIYMMDVSGSMGHEQKLMGRTTTYWIDKWISRNFPSIVRRYIIHDAQAREVSVKRFFSTRESGGTIISSAYELCLEIILTDYPINDWNVFLIHISDGDNWSEGDNKKCLKIINDNFLPNINLFGYIQTESHLGSGLFLELLNYGFYVDSFENKIRTTYMHTRDDTLNAMKEIFIKNK